ncbi:MAG: hypothetical protein LBR47_05130 [Spirochaetaceae bacterium]|nr:hypothetical protein [Spirochaetaceae bacterium]
MFQHLLLQSLYEGLKNYLRRQKIADILITDMRVPTIYLETTMFNFPFAEDSPQYKADTLQLYEEIKAGKFKPFTSEYVLDELEDTKDAEKLNAMKALMVNHKIEVLPGNEETLRLAELYIAAGVIPKKYETDSCGGDRP